MGEEQVAELKEAFELFDTARQGVLKKETLKNTLKQFGNDHTHTVSFFPASVLCCVFTWWFWCGGGDALEVLGWIRVVCKKVLLIT